MRVELNKAHSLPHSVFRILHLFFLLAVLLSFGADSAPSTRPSLLLSTPVTHSDWMVRKPAPKWGVEGVHQILDRCKEAGIHRVYWRCFDGGRALYASRLMEPEHSFDPDNYHTGRPSAWVLDVLQKCDYHTFDSFKPAIEYGHQIGLEVHAWLSINEDDHGWGLASRFSKENADSRWVSRDGRVFRSQESFAFKKVRDYKLGLVREILAYHPDGIFFDWIRTGDVRDNPHTDSKGVAIQGYEAPNLEAFRNKYHFDAKTLPNDDERWIRIRAEPQTIFMREASALIRKSNPRAVISAMVQHPWGYRGALNDTIYRDCLSGLLVDVEKWSQEHLVDEVVAAGYYRDGGNAESAWRWLQKKTGGDVQVVAYGWLNTLASVNDALLMADKVNAPELLLWESDYLGLPPENADVVARLSPH